MVSSESVRASNAQGHHIRDFVAIFVGGTGGIGESTAMELFKRTVRPRIYIVGRLVMCDLAAISSIPPFRPDASGELTQPSSKLTPMLDRRKEEADRIISELFHLNPDGKAFFIQKDITLIRSVDEVCADLRIKEPVINALFLTAGYMTLKGRRESEEGLDQKMAVNFYSRMRFVVNLMPNLTAASEAGQLSRVNSVLAAGSEGDVRIDDLDLRHNFTLHAALAHCTVFTDFMMEEFAKRYPGTTFMHSYPGTVKTGIANQLNGPIRLAVKVMYAVMTPWILNVQESGERHFFQLTSKCYPSKKWQGTSCRGDSDAPGIPVEARLDVMEGSDDVKGSGAYLLDWDSKPAGDQRVLGKYRAMDLGPKIWDHTMKMFVQAEEKGRVIGAKRMALEEADGAGRPNPIGWRAG
jgi:NAD(P)-dependent dehydrogenase (short-subunit alcohol dehydrogenase family)